MDELWMGEEVGDGWRTDVCMDGWREWWMDGIRGRVFWLKGWTGGRTNPNLVNSWYRGNVHAWRGWRKGGRERRMNGSGEVLLVREMEGGRTNPNLVNSWYRGNVPPLAWAGGMDELMEGEMDGWMEGGRDGWVDGWIRGRVFWLKGWTGIHPTNPNPNFVNSWYRGNVHAGVGGGMDELMEGEMDGWMHG